MSIAHFLTFLRFIIAPVFPILYLGHESLGISFIWSAYLSLFALAICEGSDIFDGFFARRHNQVSDLGKILDPVADTVIHMSIFLTFTQGVIGLPIWLVLIFLYRELMIGALRTLCALKGEALSARLSGKIKAVMQAVVCATIMFLMIFYAEGLISLQILKTFSFGISFFAAIYTVLSATDYVYANRAHIRKAL
jgi:CDP-diacylglycerol--glycerol-3-phosphate 3-phosphatidyltransferase